MSNNTNKNVISSLHPDYNAMEADYDLVTSLKGGRAAMLEKGEVYLPRFSNEEQKDYDKRLIRTFLDPSFSTAIESHASKPFSREIVVEGASKDLRLVGLEENADGQGNSITEFAKRVFVDADSYGMSHILADYSNVVDAKTKADEIAQGAHARLVHVKCLDLFNWRSEVKKGLTVLTEIRFWVNTSKPVGEFGSRQVRQIHRWTENAWQIWEKIPKDDIAKTSAQTDGDNINPDISGEYKIVDRGVNSLGKIPLSTVYFKRKNFMIAEPPNKELAEVNLEHYQDRSDQKELESIARCAMMFAKALEKEESDAIVVGPKMLITAAAVDASIEIIEHSGDAVTIGSDALKKLEDKMETLSLKPEMNRTSGDVTATETLTNSFNSMSDLMSWTKATEDGLIKAFKDAYMWVNEEVSDEFKLRVYDDFTVIGNMSDLPIIKEAYVEGLLSHETTLAEFKRRGVIDVRTILETEMNKASGDYEKRQKIVNPPQEKVDVQATEKKPVTAKPKPTK